MKRDYYSAAIESFLETAPDLILGILAKNNEFALEDTQRSAWLAQIDILQRVLVHQNGRIYFEYSIPRMGQRIDVILIIKSVIFVLEFKTGEKEFTAYAVDQVFDYALDLKNFHESSHNKFIAPILIASEAKNVSPIVSMTPQNDNLFLPIRTNEETLSTAIQSVLGFTDGNDIDYVSWENGRYCPTPTIIEAAKALYSKHAVEDISRNDAKAFNLTRTSKAVSRIIALSKEKSQKAICFVTGVPGAGKTLVGLDVATNHFDKKSELYSVFLSGNGPLVDVLREALARDKVKRAKKKGERIKKGEAMSEVKAFIQNVHHFRDDCLKDTGAPVEHVALFDEAQRAWDLPQTANFMLRKKQRPGFNQSESEFLISCLNRHKDWAVVVCLVGGGQEINTGEGGIGEWVDAIGRSFKDWKVYISPKINDSEYGAIKVSEKLQLFKSVEYKDELHLAVSMRSFRAEKVSGLVKSILDLDVAQAKNTLRDIQDKYPIVITRNLKNAKEWLKKQARGSERYGLIASSQAERLKPHAINVKSPVNPIHWFLHGKDDVRSSYYLEDVATEFAVQGLELDWSCVTWDGDFRYAKKGWENWAFRGSKWQHIHKEERKLYQKNAYRVLLTRARQGMVIVVPEGDKEDPTRNSKYYDPTFNYLKQIGFQII